MELTKEFFEDIKKVRENKEDAEEALERLISSQLFSNVAVFYGNGWAQMRYLAESRQEGLCLGTKDTWKELARPALFLAICEIKEDSWNNLLMKKERNSYKNDLYIYLVNTLRAEIERFLLNGTTLSQERYRDEDEWSGLDAGNDNEMYVPNAMLSSDNTEKEKRSIG